MSGTWFSRTLPKRRLKKSVIYVLDVNLQKPTYEKVPGLQKQALPFLRSPSSGQGIPLKTPLFRNATPEQFSGGSLGPQRTFFLSWQHLQSLPSTVGMLVANLSARMGQIAFTHRPLKGRWQTSLPPETCTLMRSVVLDMEPMTWLLGCISGMQWPLKTPRTWVLRKPSALRSYLRLQLTLLWPITESWELLCESSELRTPSLASVPRFVFSRTMLRWFEMASPCARWWPKVSLMSLLFPNTLLCALQVVHFERCTCPSMVAAAWNFGRTWNFLSPPKSVSPQQGLTLTHPAP